MAKLELSLRLKRIYGPEAAPIVVLAAQVKIPGQEDVLDELHLTGTLQFSWPIEPAYLTACQIPAIL